MYLELLVSPSHCCTTAVVQSTVCGCRAYTGASILRVLLLLLQYVPNGRTVMLVQENGATKQWGQTLKLPDCPGYKYVDNRL